MPAISSSPGLQQALDYLGKMMLSPGDTAMVDWPTYLGALVAFNAYEPRYIRLDPFSNESPEALAADADAAGGQVKFAYLSPDFANPTGETLSRAPGARRCWTAPKPWISPSSRTPPTSPCAMTARRSRRSWR